MLQDRTARSCNELLGVWKKTDYADPAPPELLLLVGDQVRRAIAIHLSVESQDERIPTESLAPRVIEFLGNGLDAQATKALSRIVHHAVQEIAVDKEPQDLTRLIWIWKASWSPLDAAEAERLLFALFESALCNIAARKLQNARSLQHKIEPRELIHELYIHLEKAEIPRLCENRHQFLALAGKALDNMLFDMHKAASRLKHPKSKFAVVMKSMDHPASPDFTDDKLICVEALSKLGAMYPRQRDVLKMRIFWDLSVEEVAAQLDVSTITVKRDYAHGIANLRKLFGVKP
jgi:RNA polymerase sigma factor (sigma-70 family)